MTTLSVDEAKEIAKEAFLWGMHPGGWQAGDLFN
jgi:hypothetical protein